MYYYSPSAEGFYAIEVNGFNIPADAIGITDDEYAALLSGQGSGKRIVAGSDGRPKLEAYPGLTDAQMLAQYTAAIQTAIDAKAKEWGYDSVISAASYAASTNSQFKADAAALIAWRDSVWAWAREQEAEIKAGTKDLPATLDLFVAGIPTAPAQPIVA